MVTVPDLKEALRQREESYHGLFNTIRQAVCIHDPGGRFVEVNDGACAMYGYTREEFTGRTLEFLAAPGLNDFNYLMEQFRKAFAGEPRQLEFWARRKNGEIFLKDVSLCKGTYFGNDVLIVVASDITRQKLAEKAIHESETIYRSLTEQVHDGIYLVRNGRFIYTNTHVSEITGYSSEELLTLPFIELVYPDDRAYVQDIAERRVREEPVPDRYESRIVRKDGTVRHVEVAVSVIPFEGGSVSLGAARDITGQKRMEQDLRAAKDFLNAVIDTIPEPVFVKDRQHRFVVMNRAACRFTGYEREEFGGKTDFDRFPAQEAQAFHDADEAVFTSGKENSYEHQITDASGNLHTVIAKKARFTDSSGNQFVIGVSNDITEWKCAEKALEESEERYRHLTEAITDYIYTVRIKDGHATETRHGSGCKAVTGYTTRDFSRDPGLWLRMVVEEDRAAVTRQAMAILTGGVVGVIEHRIIHKDGQVRWVRNTPVLRYDGENRFVAYDGLIQDITERKRVEEALKESEERYSALFTNNNSVSLLIDPDTGGIIDANEAACRYYGYSRNQVRLMGIYDLNRLPRDKVVNNLVRAKDEKEKHFHSTHYRADGEKRYVEVYSGPIRVQGTPLFYSIIHDITDRKRAEQALQESEERYRTLIDQLPDYVIVHRDGILLYVNPAAASRLGYSAETLIGKPVLPYIAPEYHDTVRMSISRRMAGEEIPSYEMKIVAKDGTSHTVLANGAIITFEGRPASLNVLSDISALKQAEETIQYANEELEKRVVERTDALIQANEQLIPEIAARTKAEQEISCSLKEKDLLLREIHHRVKNNLQIVSSLLKLQSRYITDPNVLASIKDSQSRVRAMALVHERIYRSHNLAEINLKKYLTYLTRQLFQFYSIPQHRITITVTMDDIMAGIDTVIPVGLIMNELVSNSLKHAFSDGRKGMISIECTPQDADTLRFVYHDNGAGLPAGFDWKNSESLGLRLVNSLVEQLDGTIETGGGEGTMFIITTLLKQDLRPHAAGKPHTAF